MLHAERVNYDADTLELVDPIVVVGIVIKRHAVRKSRTPAGLHVNA
jgi:hypothetical protein